MAAGFELLLYNISKDNRAKSVSSGGFAGSLAIYNIVDETTLTAQFRVTIPPDDADTEQYWVEVWSHNGNVIIDDVVHDLSIGLKGEHEEQYSNDQRALMRVFLAILSCYLATPSDDRETPFERHFSYDHFLPEIRNTLNRIIRRTR